MGCSPTTSSTLLLTTTLLLVLLLLPTSLALTLRPCEEEGQKAKGYTFTLDPVTGERVWSFCDFPDPRNDHKHCGLPDWPGPAFLCDPDNLIGSEKEAGKINAHLEAIQTNTSRQCTGPDGRRQGFIVAVVLVDRMRVGSPYNANSCMNECGEIHPTVNTSARAPTTGELNVAMETFAEGLRLGMRMGSCGNDLILFYSKQFNRVQTSMGWRVADVLESSDISDLHARFLSYAKAGDLEQALLYVAMQLRSDLRGLLPATIMLIVTLIAATFLAIFLVFFLHLNDIDYNVWGNEGTSKMADVAVKAVTGVYFIDWVFRATVHISGRIPLWPVVLLFVAGLACLITFFTTDNLYNNL